MDSKPEFPLTHQELKIEDLVRGIEDELTKSLVTLIYPEKIIKRFIFKPYLGKFYPFIEVWSPYHEPQYSLFYDIVNIHFSPIKKCINCKKNLDEGPRNDSFIPVALCYDCKEKAHLHYWKCNRRIIDNAVVISQKIDEKYNLSKESDNQIKITCDNLLEPDCNFPFGDEIINPCLINQAIGLIITNERTTKIIIATEDTIKFNMIYNGGLFGLIFGYSNKILNLEIVEEKLTYIIYLIREAIQIYSNKHKILIDKGNISILNYYIDENKKDRESYFELLTLNFLNYYDIKEIHTIINNYIKDPLDIISEILTKIQQETSLELLGFLELFNLFSPLKQNFREFIEQKITEELNFRESDSFLNNFSDYLKIINSGDVFKKISTIFRKYVSIHDFSNSSEELEIYEIYCSIGSILVVKANLGDNPIIVSLESLIGREIY